MVIKGPRRTGKTTLLYQYISHLLEQKVDPFAILFVSMDDINLRIPLQDLLDIYHSIIPPRQLKKQYVFLDEIQFLDNWSLMAKTLVDRDRSIQLTVSGSSASLLIKSTESLAGRVIEETILPFSVRETILIKQSPSYKHIHKWLEKFPVTDITKLSFDTKAIAYQPLLEKHTRQYLQKGGFPHLLSLQGKGVWIDLLRTDIIHKAIYKDLAQLYGLRDPLILEKLFLYLIEATSGIANFSSIAQQLKLSRETLNQYIRYLENAYFIIPLPKYSRYPKEILKSQEKLHIIDSSFRWLAGPVGDEKILESTIVSLLLRQRGARLYYWRYNYEVDCIVEQNNTLIPIEIKNTDHPFEPSEYRGLINFMEKYRVKTGFIIYRGNPTEITIDAGVIRMLPAWYAMTVL